MACLITLWTGSGQAAEDNFAGNDPGQTLLNRTSTRSPATR